MTDEHTAALERALDSVKNAREILLSINDYWLEESLVLSNLKAAENLLNSAIDEEPKG
ncbi:hypothetical protein LCGC14_1564410 [marine sediment metagenome]|uniref:Uncharacterized protein n=1 Tax=marine sediment metagenome TaxID=412755 RepID=A0A0F9L2K9_9ZZZZ